MKTQAAPKVRPAVFPGTEECFRVRYWGKDNRLKCQALVRRNGFTVMGEPKIHVTIEEGDMRTPEDDIKDKEIIVMTEADYHDAYIKAL